MILQNPTIAYVVFVGFFLLMFYTLFIWFINLKLRLIKPIFNHDVSCKIQDLPHISVVVAFRNEAIHLKALVLSLANQTYPSENFDIILVNDHSVDDWQSAIGHQPINLVVIDTEGQGKKAAIKTGVKHAKGSIIACTDADCLLSPQWLSEIGHKLAAQPSDLLIGLVEMTGDGRFLSYFQQLDFRAMQLVGLGMALHQQPIMCNGANIVMSKSAYLKHRHLVKEQYLSGDDMFLLHALKRSKASIGVLTAKNSIVHTQTEKTWRAFIRQRLRWASKSTGYTDFDTIAVAILVLLANCSFVVLLACGLMSWVYMPFFVVALLAKVITERVLFKRGLWVGDEGWQEGRFWLMQLLHPFYMVAVAFTSFVYTVKWKERKVLKR